MEVWVFLDTVNSSPSLWQAEGLIKEHSLIHVKRRKQWLTITKYWTQVTASLFQSQDCLKCIWKILLSHHFRFKRAFFYCCNVLSCVPLKVPSPEQWALLKQNCSPPTSIGGLKTQRHTTLSASTPLHQQLYARQWLKEKRKEFFSTYITLIILFIGIYMPLRSSETLNV